jgi:Ca2+/H+ antiporter
MMHGAHLFHLLNALQAGLELVVAAAVVAVVVATEGNVAAYKFSLCNMMWRSFSWAMGSGCPEILLFVGALFP